MRNKQRQRGERDPPCMDGRKAECRNQSQSCGGQPGPSFGKIAKALMRPIKRCPPLGRFGS